MTVNASPIENSLNHNFLVTDNLISQVMTIGISKPLYLAFPLRHDDLLTPRPLNKESPQKPNPQLFHLSNLIHVSSSRLFRDPQNPVRNTQHPTHHHRVPTAFAII